MELFSLLRLLLLQPAFLLFFAGGGGRLLQVVDGRRLSSRTINTKYGSLRGLINPLPNKYLQAVEMFLGVPYATPPTGYLRFMPPVALTPWRGVRTCDQLGPVCPQKFPDVTNETAALQKMPRGRFNYLRRLQPYLRNQSEDCLYLNIYVPAKVGRDPPRFPVMVYIHGESFLWNSGNPYDGSVLASFGNLIVVTINFRLGVFGFLSSEGETAPGNYGLLDQIAALHWIEENIEAFGGDPSNVTIFGQGHGAAFINFLMVSPVAKGLFHRAIVQSGSALSNWALAKDSLHYTSVLASALGCPTSNDHMTIACLRDHSMEAIQQVELRAPEYLTAVGPTVDGVVIPSNPEQSMRAFSELYGRYDMLFGVTKFETHLPFNAEDAQLGFETDKRDRILRTFIANTYEFHLREIFALLVNEYTDWTKPILHPINIRDATMEVLGDAQVVAPLVKAGSYHSSVHLNNYFYNFGYQSRDGDYAQRLGCVHGEELPYVFGAPLVDSLAHFHKNYTKAERMLSEAVMRYWTNFAKSGDPNTPDKQTSLHGGKNKNRFVKLQWPQYEMVHQKYLSIGMRPKMRHHYRAHKLSIWTQLIPEIHVAGGEGVSARHHLFDGHDDPATFEGSVRHVPDHPRPPLPAPSPPTFRMRNVSYDRPNLTDSLLPMRLTPEPPDRRQKPTDGHKNGSEPLRVEAIAPGNYSTALSVTIAVGCSLLILNVLVFAGVYYQRDKNRLDAKLQKRDFKIHKGHDDLPPPAQVAAAHHSPPKQPPLDPQQPPSAPPPAYAQQGTPRRLQQQQQQQQQPSAPAPGGPQSRLRAPPPSPVGQTDSSKGAPGDMALPESQPLLQPSAGARTGGPKNPRMQEIRV